MLTFYPPLYPDELFYSGHARYAERMAYSKSNVCMDLFHQKIKYVYPGIDRNIDTFLNQLPCSHVYTADYLIDHHTLFPLYGLVVSSETLRGIRAEMKFSLSRSVLQRLGIIQGILLSSLQFCPTCVQNDISKYGEAYWHRIHHIRGIDVCPYHGVWLESCSYNRYHFLSARQALIQDHLPRIVEDFEQEYAQLQYRLAQNAMFLLDNPSEHLNLGEIRKKLRLLLFDKGLASFNGELHLKALVSEYRRYYSKSLIEMLENKLKRNLHLLTMRYFSNHQTETVSVPVVIPFLPMFLLELSIELFLNTALERKPFGEGPWKCLNPVCKSYNQPCITNCIVTYYNQKFIGDITCKCGFSYRISRDIQSIKQIQAAQNHSEKILVNIDGEKSNSNTRKETLRKQWISLVQANPTVTRSELQAKNRSLYQRLVTSDRPWFEANSPPSKAFEGPKRNFDLFWKAKDNELLPNLRMAYSTIRQNPGKPQRISIFTFEKLLGIKLNNRKKMPLSNQFLSETCENREKYLRRRVDYFVDFYVGQQAVPAPSVFFYKLFLVYLEDPNLRAIVDEGYQRIKNAVLPLIQAA